MSLETYKGAPIYNTCPRCKNKSFQYYESGYVNKPYPNNVGKCSKCSFDYPPEQYKRSVSFIPRKYFEKSQKNYEHNNLFLYLKKEFGEDRAVNTFKRYRIGTSQTNPNSSILWYVDKLYNVREGKVILCDANTGRETSKELVSRLLRIEEFYEIPCFFGEFLLTNYPKKEVVIVESERAALIAACKYPDYLWLSVWNSDWGVLSCERETLKSRTVICKPETWDNYRPGSGRPMGR
jgi:hypothetical protein